MFITEVAGPGTDSVRTCEAPVATRPRTPIAMQIVDFENEVTEEGFLREHSDYPLQIDDLKFVVGEIDAADWLVMAFYTKHTITTSVPRERRILLMTEPSGHFPAEYVNQFGILVSPFNIPGFRGIWYQSHGAVGNFFGIEFLPRGGVRTRYDFRALRDLPVPEAKSDAISLVVSSKTQLPGHRKRLRFVRQAREKLGSRLHVFGRGFRPVATKADAILPDKYHLVLENTIRPSYWSEKLGDAYLGYAFPIVSGPPDLDRWFPSGSFAAIDIDKPDSAIDTIVRAMDDNLYEERFAAILEARRRLLLTERSGPLIARVIAAHPSTAPQLLALDIIRPMPRPGLFHRIGRETSRAFWQLGQSLRPQKWHGTQQ